MNPLAAYYNNLTIEIELKIIEGENTPHLNKQKVGKKCIFSPCLMNIFVSFICFPKKGNWVYSSISLFEFTNNKNVNICSAILKHFFLLFEFDDCIPIRVMRLEYQKYSPSDSGHVKVSINLKLILRFVSEKTLLFLLFILTFRFSFHFVLVETGGEARCRIVLLDC